MEADFSGWATKNGLKCSDGRTIMPNAFQHQDRKQVPLVWQHGHSDVENVLGHAILENRPEGVYAYGFFNESAKAKHAAGLVEHKDINSLSIWANGLIERSKNVIHGTIRELSLVLSGANPGALIDSVTIRHGDDIDVLEDEAIIYTGEVLEHSAFTLDVDDEDDLEHAGDGKTVKDIYDTLTEEQQNVVVFLIDEALKGAAHDGMELEHAVGPDATVKDVYDSMSEEQQNVCHFLVDQAIAGVEHSAIDDTNDAGTGDKEGNNTMRHNVFDQSPENKPEAHVMSHDDMKGVFARAASTGSMKSAVEEYGIQHNITNIDVMFPDAQAIEGTPEWISRRVEWVASFLSATRKSPFSRIKTLSADITEDEARAKGYITGSLKKEEFFSVNKRVTTPTTVYKKQKLDRDDIVDITDFDVVAWLKGEMRIMLDEEVARAALIGDGRDISSEDKIDEQCIRPIATDNELFAVKVYVNLLDASSSIQEFIDAVITNRSKYKGSGMPTFFTTETVIAKFLLLKDSTGRKIYTSLAEIALELRCKEIVPVEVMEEDTTLIGIMVNPSDYVFGTDRGGEVSMFDDFDIDYNNLKYLIETRASGALVKLKSALVFRQTASTDVLATPTEPAFVVDTGVITIPTVTGVTYKRGDTNATVSAGAMTALADGATLNIYAVPSTGYFFATSEDDSWNFTRDAGA